MNDFIEWFRQHPNVMVRFESDQIFDNGLIIRMRMREHSYIAQYQLDLFDYHLSKMDGALYIMQILDNLYEKLNKRVEDEND